MAEFDLQPVCNFKQWTCKKCTLQLETPFCPMCGAAAPADKPARKSRTRPNGAGTAFRRGKTWTARVVVGWKLDGDKALPVYRSRGGFPTKREALEACRDLLTAPKAVKRLSVQQIYVAWYAQHEGRVGRSTMGCYQAAWRYFAPLYWMPFAEIGLDDLQDCVDDCPCGKRTKENMKALAGLLMKYALPRHQTDMNYAEFLNTGNGAKGTRPPFTPDQVEAIRRQIGVTPYAEHVYSLIYTGFRPAELFALTPDDYRGGVLYGGAKTEAGRDRAVPVSRRIAGYIRTDCDYLFPRADGSRLTPPYFRDSCFYPVLAAAGIQPLPDKDHPARYVPYSCRHTFANLLKLAPGSDKDKAGLIGHEDYRTTKRMYQSAELDALRAIIDWL